MGPKTNVKRQEHRQVKKQRAESQRDIEKARSAQLHALPVELQQVILNVFKTAFPVAQNTEELKQVIQEVKGHLFNRDFSSAFARPSYLQAYALRWSAARAIGYSHILTHSARSALLCVQIPEPTVDHVQPDSSESTDAVDTQPCPPPPTNATNATPVNVVCLGGGAGAEIVALAAAHSFLESPPPLHIMAIDNADWSEPISKLTSALATPPALPSQASEAAKGRPENQALLHDPSNVSVTFLKQDVLTWETNPLATTLSTASLCTIMFTLNELFSTSLPQTTSFLLKLTASMPKRSHLLVIDSPGSYSEIQLGKRAHPSDSSTSTTSSTKRYPMKWLLDHTLLEIAQTEGEAAWKKVESEESVWFRIEQGERERLKYPVELENMRYQLHLYQRL